MDKDDVTRVNGHQNGGQADFFRLYISDSFQSNRGIRTLEEIERAFCNALGHAFTLNCDHNKCPFYLKEVGKRR